MRVVIVGSGTAGLMSALYLKEAFPLYDITVVSSSKIGIIGVGEGSTEHWKQFQDFCRIDSTDMITKTDATCKFGIKFENWSVKNKEYFHSISTAASLFRGSFIASYANAIYRDGLLTNKFANLGRSEYDIHYYENFQNQIPQFHFDTNKLNRYLQDLSIERRISFIDDEFVSLNRNSDTGFIESINLESNEPIYGDFFIDASGLQRVLMKNLEDQEFISYEEYLPCDSAIAFPTESDPSGRIRAYTRAIAMNNGWVWEIPTQARRGNGYVFSSKYTTVDGAVEEISSMYSKDVIPAKSFNFTPGYYKKTWQRNCMAIGLSAAFVEPLEATSISTSLQQVMLLCSYLPTFNVKTKYSINEYHRIMDSIMENILCMISMHYQTDRVDTPMWRDQAHMKKPEMLENLLNLWSERLPEPQDIPRTGYELFQTLHFYHVAQGQNLINVDNAKAQLKAYDSDNNMDRWYEAFNGDRMSLPLVDHRKALMGLYG